MASQSMSKRRKAEPIERTLARALVARASARKAERIGLPQGLDYSVRLPLRAAILLERYARGGRDHGQVIAEALAVFDSAVRRERERAERDGSE